jgi:hypothetical protein
MRSKLNQYQSHFIPLVARPFLICYSPIRNFPCELIGTISRAEPADSLSEHSSFAKGKSHHAKESTGIIFIPG